MTIIKKFLILLILIYLSSMIFANNCDVTINTAQDLRNLSIINKAGRYCLGADIDLEGIEFAPIYSKSKIVFDGQGHTIKNLTSKNMNYSGGLFNTTYKDIVIQNLQLINTNISNYLPNSALIGLSHASVSINNVAITGGNIICQSHYCGSFIGFSSGDVKITSSYSSINITAASAEAAQIGGFIGASFNQAYSLGSGTISHSYFSGSIKSNPNVSIQALIGNSLQYQWTCSNSYWDKDNINTFSSTICPDGGRSSKEMQTESTYANWNFTNIWVIDPTLNNGYPYLKEFARNY